MTIELVLGAIDKEVAYGIVVNKVSKTLAAKLKVEENAVALCMSLNSHSHKPTARVHIYEENLNLRDADNVLHAPTEELIKFIQNLPSCIVKPEDVRQVRPKKKLLLSSILHIPYRSKLTNSKAHERH